MRFDNLYNHVLRSRTNLCEKKPKTPELLYNSSILKLSQNAKITVWKANFCMISMLVVPYIWKHYQTIELFNE